MLRTMLSIDLECYDPNLKELGTGVFRGDAYVLGISVADDAGLSEYYNIGHKEVTEAEKRKNWGIIEKLLLDPCPKVFANGMYDLTFLVTMHHLTVNGSLHDVIHAESLLNEYRDSYSLDSIAMDRLGVPKEKGAIEAFCEEHGLKGDPRKHLYLMPYATVAPYAKMDTKLLIPILRQQLPLLEAEGLTPLYDMERALFPYMLKMQENGLRVDEKRRKELVAGHQADLDKRQRVWQQKFPGVNINSTKQLCRVFEDNGVPYDVSNSGKELLLGRLGRKVDKKRLPMIDVEPLFDELQMSEADRRKYYMQYPSITSLILEAAAEDHPLAEEVEGIKRLDKLIGTFFNGYLVKYAVNGIIHPSYSIFVSDDGGCVTGRMSSRHPNGQNFPAVKGDFNPHFRDAIISKEGYWFGKIDYSSQENRILAHYAVGPMSEEIREQYRANPHLDMHQTVANWTGLTRKEAKRLGFGMSYGMGPTSMGKKFLWTPEKAQALYNRYIDAVPFILNTRNKVGEVARSRGYIYTLLGRHGRFTEKMKKERKDYLFLNKLIQGSAADMTKKALYDSGKAGIFDVLDLVGIVHDEFDVEIPKTRQGVEAFEEMQHIMEKAITLKVPVLAEAEHGPSWGEVEVTDFEKMRNEC